jgi:hypothetical protein
MSLVRRVNSPSNGLYTPSLPPRFLLTLALRKGEEADPLSVLSTLFPNAAPALPSQGPRSRSLNCLGLGLAIALAQRLWLSYIAEHALGHPK